MTKTKDIIRILTHQRTINTVAYYTCLYYFPYTTVIIYTASKLL